MTIFDRFSHIFLLTLSNRADRTSAALRQLSYIGNGVCSLSVQYATPFPYNNIIIDAFNKSGKGRFTKPNEYDCSRNHYSMIKQAYDLGWDEILIIEDDLQFIKDPSIWDTYLAAIPKDYDIIQFGGFTADPKIIKYLTAEDLWFKHKDVGVWTTSMYALSRKGMSFYLAFMDKIFWVADGPLYKAPLNDKLINTYLCKMPLVIQADKNTVLSDIRSEETDDIDYNNQNLYEKFVNKSQYTDYQ